MVLKATAPFPPLYNNLADGRSKKDQKNHFKSAGKDLSDTAQPSKIAVKQNHCDHSS